MIGLMKKDLFLIKNNKNVIIIAFMMVIIFGVLCKMDISFLLPFMLLTTYMSTFSYDEFNNFNSFVCTLPNGRESVVKSKYLLTIILTFIISVIGFIVTLFVSNSNIEEIVSTLTGTVFALILVISFLYPIMFKFGAEKGRIVLLVAFFGIGSILTILMRNISLNDSSSFIYFLDTYGLILIIVISVISLTVSYFISKRIYLNKEF